MDRDKSKAEKNAVVLAVTRLDSAMTDMISIAF